jgi:ATP-dependent Clp protease ATP-binding subunit ClpC
MRDNFYFLYYFFDNPYIRWIRVAAFFFIGFFVYINLGNEAIVLRILPLYFVLILQEFFIHFKLENSIPPKRITDSFTHPIECVDFKTRVLLERYARIEDVLQEIIKNHEVAYFNRLLHYSFVASNTSISEENLLKKATEIVKIVNGKYIHSIDIYVSYLLLLDNDSKTLFQNDITKEDVLNVFSWVRKEYRLDMGAHAGFHFTGSGVFDFFIYGWSAQISRYAVNFTREILSRPQSAPLGRDREYDLLITALSKNSSSNALLVGPAGVGKTALISQLVLDSNAGILPKSISNKIVFKLHPEHLLSGITNEGDLEERFIALFSELVHAGNIIVYIPNIENIFGGGGMNVDISGALVEYLRTNRIKIVGSTTLAAFQSFIYPKQEVKELFDIVEVNEPDPDAILFMVFEKAKEFERLNNVSILFSGIKEACKLSQVYSNDGTAMPGRAIHLLDDVISYSTTHGVTIITKEEVQAFVEEKTHMALDKPDREESEKLLNLEKEVHKRIISQDEAIGSIADAMRRVRSGMNNEGRPIASFLFLGQTGVGKTEMAKALANSYFGNEKTMIRLDMSEYQSSQSVERLLGKSGGEYEETIVDKVMENPFSLILLDEFEKASPQILDLFLQVLDEGRLTDNLGRTASFVSTIIIATSNAGSEYIREKYKEGTGDEVKKQLVEKVLQMNIFKPELINRFDDVIIFKPLSESDVKEIAKLFLKDVITKISEQQITLSYDEDVLQFIAANSYSIEFGARNVRRFIEQSIENQISKLILSDVLQKGGEARIVIENSQLVIKT